MKSLRTPAWSKWGYCAYFLFQSQSKSWPPLPILFLLCRREIQGQGASVIFDSWNVGSFLMYWFWPIAPWVDFCPLASSINTPILKDSKSLSSWSLRDRAFLPYPRLLMSFQLFVFIGFVLFFFSDFFSAKSWSITSSPFNFLWRCFSAISCESHLIKFKQAGFVKDKQKHSPDVFEPTEYGLQTNFLGLKGVQVGFR